VAPAAPVDRSVPATLIAGDAMFVPGEYLSFKVKWKGFAGGSTQIISGQPGVEGGRNALVVRSITATEGLMAVFKRLRDELTTVIDVDSGAPISSQNAVEVGRDLGRIDIAFGDRMFTVDQASTASSRESWKQIIPEDGPWAHDLHSILAHLRAWSPPLGSRGFCYVQSAKSFFRLDVVAAGREVVETDAGDFEALRFEGVATGLDRLGKPLASGLTRKMSFWISTGDERIPVKLLSETQYGDVYAVLVEYRGGGAPITSGRPRGRRGPPGDTRSARTESEPSTP
jgi:hypothetical protein